MTRIPLSRRFFVMIIALLLITFARCAQASNFDEPRKKIAEHPTITDELPRTLPVAFTSRKIAKGHVFTSADVEERKINIDQVPADAVISCRKLVGRKSLTTLNAGEVVPVQDLGFAVTESQVAGMTARDWRKFNEKMGSICYANVEIKPGEKFKASQLIDQKMPLRIVPCDAVAHASLVAGKICKFGCAKKHIIMQHDLF